MSETKTVIYEQWKTIGNRNVNVRIEKRDARMTVQVVSQGGGDFFHASEGSCEQVLKAVDIEIDYAKKVIDFLEYLKESVKAKSTVG